MTAGVGRGSGESLLALAWRPALVRLGVVARLKVSFRCRMGDSEKTQADLRPYKLMNHKRIWYLAAVSGAGSRPSPSRASRR